ncbi:3660_t:CDS:2 [Paraglomus occultum]|uniref:3660_t:CDS:1 n=1 Tax=Paraglomus occultum TaxID=144539 RepID=A0A9N8ZF88_9GLOM|nr:3660_t:CDS:2 [Paraglomus occultum]
MNNRRLLRFTGSFHPSGFWILFIGQTIDAAAQVFILGVPPKLVSVWFSMGQQNLAISVGIMANNAGVAAGFLLFTMDDKRENSRY